MPSKKAEPDNRRSLAETLRAKGWQPPTPKPAWQLRPQVLLCPNTPRPMHGVVPRNLLGKAWWDRTRKLAYASTNFHCVACGVHKSQARFRQWLEGHEIYGIDYVKGRLYYLETVPLCHCCHAYIHDGRLQVLLERGKISHAKYAAILQHGDEVLMRAGLNPLDKGNAGIVTSIAPWHKWRLVIEGKHFDPPLKRPKMFRPLFNSEAEWHQHWIEEEEE